VTGQFIDSLVPFRSKESKEPPEELHRSACAVTIVKIFLWLVFVDAAAALSLYWLSFGIAMAARMPMIAITISSSMRVKPDALL
jgi:hypothetical protein